jgi:chromatin modification-related protein EAF6
MRTAALSIQTEGTIAECTLQEASTPGSATTTPSHAPTPTSSFPTRESSQPTPNGNKNGVASKKKKAADDEDTDSKPAKRGKITYGRD